MHFLCISFYWIFCFIVVLIQEGLPKPLTPGSWHECSGKYYYLGSNHDHVYSAHSFCGQLGKSTHLADLGSSPIPRAEQMLVGCKLPFVNNRQYWIECQYGQRQSECTVLIKQGGRINIDIVSCSSNAYPICETLSNPVTSTVAPATNGKTLSVTSSVVPSTHGKTFPMTSSVAPITHGKSISVTSTVAPITHGNSISVTSTVAPITYGNSISVTSTVASITHGNSIFVTSTVAPVTHGNSICVTSTVAPITHGNSISVTSTVAPITHGNNISMTSTVAPITHGNSISVTSTVAYITHGNSISVTSTVAPITHGNTDQVKSTVASATHAAVGLPSKITPAPFPRRCASVSGWFGIGQHSYCITNRIYNYTDAWMACMKVNGSLADLHSAIKTLQKIIGGLGLSQAVYLKAWVKGNGTEGTFQIDGVGNYHFRHEPFEFKHRIFCEREMRPSATPFNPHVPSSPTYLSTAFSKSHAPSTKSLMVTSSTTSTTTREATTVTPSVIHTSPSHANPISSLTSSVPVTPRTGPPKAPSTTSITANNSWTKIDGQEYYTNYKLESYADAAQYCSRILNASLIAFLNPVRYFQVMAQINPENGSYWIGSHQGSTTSPAEKCVSYHKQTSTLSQSECPMKFYSVCSRSVFGNNITKIMADPVFKRRLKELTVDKSETSVNKRKLVSVNDDKRPSAKAVGSLSVLVLCITIALLLLVDLTKVGRVCLR